MCVDTGADVARKVVILARECGLQVGLDDLQVSSLVPQPLQGLASADEFMQQLPQVRLRGVSTEQSGADVACGGGGAFVADMGHTGAALISAPTPTPHFVVQLPTLSLKHRLTQAQTGLTRVSADCLLRLPAAV